MRAGPESSFQTIVACTHGPGTIVCQKGLRFFNAVGGFPDASICSIQHLLTLLQQVRTRTAALAFAQATMGKGVTQIGHQGLVVLIQCRIDLQSRASKQHAGHIQQNLG